MGRQELDLGHHVTGGGLSLPRQQTLPRSSPGQAWLEGPGSVSVQALMEFFFQKDKQLRCLLFQFPPESSFRPAHPRCPSVNRKA